MKEKHPFDLVSLVFGALFVVLALPVLLTDTPLSIDSRWMWPVAVIVLGALVAGSGLRRRDDESDALEVPTADS
jgi:cytochrome c-type biogenesis protein CcmH/NrfF